MAQKLTGDARKAALGKLRGWSEVHGRDAISKKFTFEDFNAGLRLHGAGGAGRRKARPSSRVVQRLQQSRGDAVDPRCRRRDRAATSSSPRRWTGSRASNPPYNLTTSLPMALRSASALIACGVSASG